MDRNEVKLEMMKKVLGAHNWKLWQNKRIYPQHIFILDGNGRVMAEYLSNRKSCYVNILLYSRIKDSFGFSLGGSVKVFDTFFPKILQHRFKLEVNNFNLETDFIIKQWDEIEMNLEDGEFL